MSRPQPVDIALGDKSFRIRPLTCAQVQEIDPHLSVVDGKLNVASALNIIRGALSRDHADVKLDELEATTTDIYAATTSIMKLMNGGDEPAGEAEAAANASNGATSTQD